MDPTINSKHQLTKNPSQIYDVIIHLFANELSCLLLLTIAIAYSLQSPLYYTALSSLPSALFASGYLLRILLKDWDFSIPFFYSGYAHSAILLGLANALSFALNIASIQNTATLITLSIAILSTEHICSLLGTSVILGIEHP